MAKLKLASLFLGFIFAAFQTTWAQGTETEPVERYRKTVEFTMPEAGQPSSTGTTVRNADPSTGTPGLHYNMEPGVRKLLDTHKRRNDAAEEADGFRIQIYAGGDQKLANEARTDFLANFGTSKMEVHLTWDPPHFRVRVGDFRTRADAMRELPNVRRIFPDGFVVSDKVKIRKNKRPAPAPGPVSPGTKPGADGEEDRIRTPDNR